MFHVYLYYIFHTLLYIYSLAAVWYDPRRKRLHFSQTIDAKSLNMDFWAKKHFCAIYLSNTKTNRIWLSFFYVFRFFCSVYIRKSFDIENRHFFMQNYYYYYNLLNNTKHLFTRKNATRNLLIYFREPNGRERQTKKHVLLWKQQWSDLKVVNIRINKNQMAVYVFCVISFPFTWGLRLVWIKKTLKSFSMLKHFEWVYCLYTSISWNASALHENRHKKQFELRKSKSIKILVTVKRVQCYTHICFNCTAFFLTSSLILSPTFNRIDKYQCCIYRTTIQWHMNMSIR